MYGEYISHQTIDGFWAESSDEDFPTTRIRSNTKPDVTVVCYGGCLGEAEKAIDRLFDEHELVAEIVCPIQIYPLNIGPILDSVKRTGRLLVVEEGQGFCGFGAEVIASVHHALPQGTPLLSRRLSALPHPLASSKTAELESLPGADSILRSIVEMVGHG
jgi:2-oxoisovalerate dehydrogenase E1 component